MFGDSFYFAVATLAAFGMVFLRRNRGALLLALFLTFLFVPFAKNHFGQERPCNGLYWCPADKGFPSGHAAATFVFVGASLGTLSFYAFLPIALAVSYSRIADGVHTLLQVAGGAATGLVIFFVCRQLLDQVHELDKRHKWFTGGAARKSLWYTRTRTGKDAGRTNKRRKTGMKK